MRLRSHLIEIAAAVTLAALAGSDALAQGRTTDKAAQTPSQATPSTPPSTAGKANGATGAQKGAGTTMPSSGPWTADNVTAARPFGNINVSAAGNSTESVRTWVQGRSATERAELSGRCQVITSSANASKYPADAQQFCRNYMMVASANPAGKTTGKAGTTTR